MIDAHQLILLSAALVAILALIALIVFARLNPLLTLIAVSIALGLATGMPPHSLVSAFEQGAGATLGHIAIVVALGAMLGKMMAVSGGATVIANTLIRVFGERRIHWAMLLIGLLVGLPSFFEVGFVLLIPIVFSVARRTGTRLILIALPLTAGLSIVHGLVPPHPAASMTVAAYNADVGRTILFALLVGLPAAILAGPIYTKWLAKSPSFRGQGSAFEKASTNSAIELSPQSTESEDAANQSAKSAPSFALTLATILLPVALMLLGSLADTLTHPSTAANEWLHLIGNDDLALFIGVLVSFYSLGARQGFSRATILRFSSESLAPIASILLLVGAGGGFGRILATSGVSQAVVAFATELRLPLILLAWLLAALMRLATGSSTVAMTTAAGIVAPIAVHATGATPELLVIATGSGALIFSHVNDAGFWLVKESLGLTVAETLATWSVMETILSLCGLAGAFALSALL